MTQVLKFLFNSNTLFVKPQHKKICCQIFSVFLGIYEPVNTNSEQDTTNMLKKICNGNLSLNKVKTSILVLFKKRNCKQLSDMQSVILFMVVFSLVLNSS